MAAKLDHLIVQAADKVVSAKFLTDILGLTGAEPSGPFLAVTVANGVTMDFFEPGHDFLPQHYAFSVDDERFEAVLVNIGTMHLLYWADPFHREPNVVANFNGERHVYFNDPSGHNLEVLTNEMNAGGLPSAAAS
ncbi:MAG: VOC family protein [Methylocella sp.]